MDTNADNVVAGESVLDLLPVLVAIVEQSPFKPRPDGMYSFNAKVPTAQLIPYKRALMRVEAELLVEEAATGRTTFGRPRGLRNNEKPTRSPTWYGA